MSDYNLLDVAWLPVRTAAGVIRHLRPAEITEPDDADDPVVAFAWGRADLDVASMEFPIGLLTTALGEALDEDRWWDWWEKPPDAAGLDALFAPLRAAFVLDAPEGQPRFLQDLSPLADGVTVPVDGLLIDQAGAAPLFMRAAQVRTLSRGAAAMALFTLQAWAPAGGRGHRTSLRGGGPFVTLVEPRWRDPQRPMSLWRRLWLNVVPVHGGGRRPERRFPWLYPTRTSEKGETTTPADVDSLQAFWGMPRRIRLTFEPNVERLACDLTGMVDEMIVRTFRARHGGTNYAAWSRAHPLTPYYRTKPTETEWLPAHPQPRRLCHRDWIGLVLGEGGSGLRSPAECLTTAWQRILDLPALAREARLWAAGYDMDNMKARGFADATLPVLVVPDAHAQALRTLANGLVQATDIAVRIVKRAVRTALKVETNDKGAVAMAGDRLWEVTEAPFFASLRGLVPDERTEGQLVEQAVQAQLAGWCPLLRQQAERIFHALCPPDLSRLAEVEVNAQAARQLRQAFAGYGKDGADLFAALQLPVPVAGKKTKAGKNPKGGRKT